MAIITYDGDEFKSIDCIPEYADYPTIYVAKTPHVDETGHSYQVINTAWGNQKTIHPILSSEDGAGYLFIRLPRVGNKRPNVGVHRLIILTWGVIPEGYQELQVNHIDENKHNNRLENLELITARENLIWGTRLRRVAASLARNGHTVKLVAINIRTEQEWRFDNTCECARRLRLNQSHVSACLNNDRRQHKGFVFCRQEDYSPAKVDELIAAATRRKTKN